ncbi:MAG TPA: hypothetical protein VD931_19925 [Baekduia sp.]|nr:hypothetical protein [Baekduia sp.]
MADLLCEPAPPPLEPLPAPPPGLARTREALHRLAAEVLSPAQERVNGDIHFRWTPGGFGTPVFGSGRQLRVDGATVVVTADGASRRRPVRSLRDAASFAGLARTDVEDAPLDVDDPAARWLGSFFGFAFALLAELAASAPDAAPIRLWPEHFDIATDFGDEAVRARATYGASPGDADHAEPYLYVGPWVAPEPGGLWNATGFPGAELRLGELLAAGDQAAAARGFFATRRAALGRLGAARA